MNVLIVGAGAIGQVFGRHLQLGGAHVNFLVRPRYAEDARDGFVMYPLNRWAVERNVPERFEGFGVYDDQDVALKEDWDLIVLAISSVALRAGDWFEKLAAGMGNARLLSLVPGADDPELVHAHVNPDRVAWAMLSVISYQAPLPGEHLPELGVAYWFPWGGTIGFSGAPSVVTMATTTLERGGMPVHRSDDVHAEVAFMGAILDKVVVALEVAGWSFRRLRRDGELMSTAHGAMQEAWNLAEATSGQKRPFVLSLVRPFVLRAVLWLAPRILPLDLESFFAYHYAKVAEQTILLTKSQIAKCDEHGVSHVAISDLLSRIEEKRRLGLR